MRSLGSFVLLIGNEKTKVDLRIPLKYYLASEETKNSEGFHLSCHIIYNMENKYINKNRKV